MDRIEVSTLTGKGQASIPVKIRELLSLQPGDKIIWEEKDGKVTVNKASDIQWNLFAYSSLSDWDNSADDEAYNDL